ncbi:MAG: metallophosphoesterase, partial [Bacteroidaceae bacterium]|nr:metallophosphoesterase [Bacteroidaceae bacterium]
SSAILHISDLHFPLEDNNNYRINNSFKTLFIEYVKNLKHEIKYLVVTGDISNESAPKEYDNALNFLSDLISEENLNINKNNILLCPGNHDISQTDLSIHRRGGNCNSSNEYLSHSIKFKHFNKFYSDFFENKKEFDCEKAIFDKIVNPDDSIIICGLNSCFRESSQKCDHIGYIEENSFEEDLQKISKEYPTYLKLLALHHNPKDFKAEKQNLENWNTIKQKLNHWTPYAILSGHIHGSDKKSEFSPQEGESCIFLSAGSLFQKVTQSTNMFNIYSINRDKITPTIYELRHPDDTPQWDTYSPQNNLQPFSLQKTKSINPPPIQGINISNIEQNLDNKLYNTKEQSKNIENIKTDKSIINFIRERNLFKSGHFHWNNGFRSHGFIDINNLVSRKDSLEVITEQFYKQISLKNENNFIDTIMIAVGIECNVIGARLSALFDCKYSFIPEPTKDEHFTNIETKINSGDYQNIILLKDIIFKADHLKDLLEKEGIKNKNVCIVSFFYCGVKNEKENIFSEYTNVSFISICDDITINQCNYSGNDNQNKCPIYTHKLETIYDEC